MRLFSSFTSFWCDALFASLSLFPYSQKPFFYCCLYYYRFHAAWCKSCQRFGLKYQGLANHKTDWIAADSSTVVREGQARFGSIEYGANMDICRKLGIKRLPTVQMYQKRKGLLQGFACGPKKFPLLLERLEYNLHKIETRQHEQEFASILEQGNELMASTTANGAVAESSNSDEMAVALNEMMEQEANGSLESKASINKKSWWRKIVP